MSQLKYTKWQIYSFLHLPDTKPEYQVLVPWINFVSWEGRERKEGVLSLGKPMEGEVPLLGNLCSLLLPWSWPLSLLFLRMVFGSCPVGVGNEVGGGLSPPPCYEGTDSLTYRTLVFRKEGLQMTSKTVLLFSQTKTIGRSRIILPG